MSKLDKIIALMDAHHFRNLKEICEIPAHRSAIEAIINEQPSEEIVHRDSGVWVGCRLVK